MQNQGLEKRSRTATSLPYSHFKRSVYTFCVRSHWMIPFNLLNGHSNDAFVSLIRISTGN